MPRPTSPISTARASTPDARWRAPISSITALAAFGKRASLPSDRAAALVFVPDEPVMMRRAGTMYELVSLVSIARPTGGGDMAVAEKRRTAKASNRPARSQDPEGVKQNIVE